MKPLAILAALAVVAVVLVLWLEGSGEGIPEPEAPSPIVPPEDADWRKELDVPISLITEEIEKERGAVSTTEVSSTEDPPEAESSAQAILVVTVLGQSTGQPVPNARIRALQPGADGFRSISTSKGGFRELPVTGEDGTATLSVLADSDLRVSVESDDVQFSPVREEQSVLSPHERREIVLFVQTETDGTLWGRVLAAEDQNPIAGAELRVERSTGMWMGRGSVPWSLGGTAELETDANGEFRLPVASWRCEVGTFTAAGRGPVLAKLGAEGGSREHPLVIRLSRAAGLRGRVLGTDGIEGSTRVRLTVSPIYLSQPEGAFVMGRDRYWDGEVAADGAYALAGLPPGVPFEASILTEGEVVLEDPTRLTLAAGESLEKDWRIRGGATVMGRAVDGSDRSPQADLEIWLVPAHETYRGKIRRSTKPTDRATTDADGRFALADVAPGEWIVGPAPAKRPLRSPARAEAAAAVGARVVVGSEPAVEVVLSVWRGAFIEGLVLDPQGAAAGGAFVAGRGGAGESWFDTLADADGRFRLGPLVPGRYRITASPSGPTEAESEPVEAGTGDTDVVLRLSPGGSLAGVVVDADTGEPVPAEVLVHEAAGSGGIHMLGARGEGRFEIGGLAPGDYHLTASTGDGRIGFLRGVPLLPGAEVDDLRIALDRGGCLLVSYTGPIEIGNVSVVSDGVTFALDGMRSGQEKRITVPPGTLTVRLEVYDRRDPAAPVSIERERTVEISAGEELEVVFELDG